LWNGVGAVEQPAQLGDHGLVFVVAGHCV